MDINSKVSFTRNLYQINKDRSQGFTDVEADFTGFPGKKAPLNRQTIDGLNAGDGDDLYSEFENYRTDGQPIGDNDGSFYYSTGNGCTYTKKRGKYLGQGVHSNFSGLPYGSLDIVGDSP